jgi:alcohol oxidase
MAAYDASMGDMDIIFAGGGTAACVAAGRLAKANPDLKILLIEGGQNNFNDPTVVNPALYLTHLAPDSKTAIVCSVYSLNHFQIQLSSNVRNRN